MWVAAVATSIRITDREWRRCSVVGQSAATVDLTVSVASRSLKQLAKCYVADRS
jgi:hypothetical protein